MTKNHFVFLALYLISCSLFAEESKPQTLYEQFIARNERFLPPPNGTYVVPPERQKYVRQIISLIGDKTGKAFTNIPTDPSFRLELALACYKIECPIALKHKLSSSLKNISDQTEDGRNILFYSVYYRDYTEVERLLKLGADPSPHSDYNPLLLSIYMHDWRMFKILNKYEKQMSSYPTDDVLKLRIRGIIPSSVSKKLHQMSVQLKRSKYSYLEDTYYLKKFKKTADGLDHQYVHSFFYELRGINFFLRYHDLKDRFSDVGYPCLVEPLTRVKGRTEEEKLSTLYVASKPSWSADISSLIVNPYENARYTWDQTYGRKIEGLTARYFVRDETKYKKDYLDSFVHYSQNRHLIAVDQVQGHWLGVMLKGGRRGWIHSSQLFVSESYWKYWYSSSLKISVNEPIRCNRENIIPLGHFDAEIRDIQVSFKEYAPGRLPRSLYRVEKNNLIIDMKGSYCSATELLITYSDSNQEYGYSVIPVSSN